MDKLLKILRLFKERILKPIVIELFNKKNIIELKVTSLVLPFIHKLYIRQLKNKEKINVTFIAMSLSMWRYQRLYELLNRHPRFNVSLVLLPCRAYSLEQQEEDISKLKTYFDSKQILYYVGGERTSLDIKKELSPDILFYPQPYRGLFSKKDDYLTFKYRLLCYYPYAFWTATKSWSYNKALHNYAWKLFYSTELHLNEAKKYAYNKGKNVEVVGYPNADDFLFRSHNDVWKPQPTKKKRIIWAPHFTIFSGGLLNQSNFLWMADFMLMVLEKYASSIQFAFKPHPRLKTELYKHEDWGKEKTDKYYSLWENNSSSQLETGDFVDLFMTSDAMIHDSASFSVEYHYSRNPVMYIATNFEEQLSEKGEFGKLALLQHYVGGGQEDIINFIESVVIKGEDTMKESRKSFYNNYLLPPNGKSVAENTYDIFLKYFCK